uniref:CUB domain-containing protein n=1 Tax=Trichuris muris TaxID=70415 RepID=A0A5S6R140_TRIMR
MLTTILLLLWSTYVTSLYTDCGFDRVLNVGDVVSVVSPNYPSDPYPHNSLCIWRFKSMANAVELSTHFFDVEHYAPNHCPDTLTIQQPNGSVPLTDCCFKIPKLRTFGAEPPFNFSVTFRSDDHIHWMGFNVSFRAYNAGPSVQSKCGYHRLKKPTSKFSMVSPNWPLSPTKPVSCSWTIENALPYEGYLIKLEFVHMGKSVHVEVRDNGEPVKLFTDCASTPERIWHFRNGSISVHYKATGTSLYDERLMVNVSIVEETTCREVEVKCPGSNRCVHIEALCSGEDVCADGSDQRLSICRTLKTCGKQKVKPNIDFAIVGTNKAKPGSWPWMAMLYSKYETGELDQMGPATVIAPRWLLTSTKLICNFPNIAGGYVAQVGVNNIEQPETNRSVNITVSQVVFPKEFEYPSMYGDLALIMLDHEIPMPFNDRINTACLPPADNPYDMDEWPECITTTWRWDHPLITQLQASVLNLRRCGLIPEFEDGINSNALCAELMDSEAIFSGYYGSPLICLDKEEKTKQFESVRSCNSFGRRCSTSNGLIVVNRSHLDGIVVKMITHLLKIGTPFSCDFVKMQKLKLCTL